MIVGIDLGTTNSALAHVDPERSTRLVSDEIAQLVGAGRGAAAADAAVVPLPGGRARAAARGAGAAVERRHARGAIDRIVGELARAQGADVPGRLVASAKWWLCHPRVDRLAPILPWGESAAESRRISPVEPRRPYLAPPRRRLGHATGRALADEEVVLTVPASFDEVARELTRARRARAGLGKLTLLEEPQAAFYAWLADHRGARRRSPPATWCSSATSAAAPPTSRSSP